MPSKTTTNTQQVPAQQSPELLDADDPIVLEILEREADERARAIQERNAWNEAQWAAYDAARDADDFLPDEDKPRSIRTLEEWARRLLDKAGFRGVLLSRRSKARRYKGTGTLTLPEIGESWGVVAPSGYLIIDPDSEDARKLVDKLKLPPTLTIRTARGLHLYFRLPPGMILPKKLQDWRKNVDVIAGDGSYVVAPGSQARGHYYAVVRALPIAELPLDVAEVLVAAASEPDPPRRKLEWVCGPARNAVRERAEIARAHRLGKRKARKPSLWNREANRQEWLNETRDGHRHQALLRLALRALGEGWSYEQYEAEILTHPIRCKLDGQSPGWLRKWVWAKAEKLFKPPKSPPNRQWRRHGAGVVQRWLNQALLQVPTDQLRELLQLFATWAERFGPTFYLCQGLMKLWLDRREGDWRLIRDKKAGTGLLVDLLARGLIVEHSRDDLPTEDQATYWDLNLDQVDAELNPPPNGIGALAQGSDLRVLSEEDIDRLLYAYGGYTGESFSGATEFEGSAGGLAAA